MAHLVYRINYLTLAVFSLVVANAALKVENSRLRAQLDASRTCGRIEWHTVEESAA